MLRVARQSVNELPGARRHTIAIALRRPTSSDASRPGVAQEDARALHLIQQRGPCRPDVHQDGCFYVGLGRSTSLAIGADARVDRLIAGPAFDAAARRALAAGKVLVFDAAMLDRAGDVHVATGNSGVASLPGQLVATDEPYRILPVALVSERAARAQGWEVGRGTVLVSYAAHASRDQVAAALAVVEQSGAVANGESEPSPRKARDVAATWSARWRRSSRS